MRMLKGMFMTCGAHAPSNQLAGALYVIIAALATIRASTINPNNLRQVHGSIFLFASCVVCR